MARPAIGAAVREGRREGVVVAHAGRGSMVDVQFDDVDFVERRSAERLTPSVDWAEDQKRATVQATYESLLLKELGRKQFRFRGERADVSALDRGVLDREDIDRLLSRAFAIATRRGQKQGDIEAGGAKATAAGRALSALRRGASPTLVVRQMKAAGVSQSAIDRVLRLSKGRDPEESAQRLADYEETLALRKKPAPRRRKNVAQGNQMPTGFMPVLRNGLVSSALSLGARGVRALAPAFRTLADFGRRGVTLTKDMLNTPAGAQVAGAITAVAVSIFGRKVVESGKLTRQEAAVVQDVIMAQSGVSVSPAVISAAVKETT
jgi:hypothetical protein